MKVEDYQAKFALFYKSNPTLTPKMLAVVLTADLIYKDIPEDIAQFRKKYAHFDPTTITKPGDGITFLKIVQQPGSEEELKERLNAYLNIKFNHIKQKKSYKANSLVFKEKSIIASKVIEVVAGISIPFSAEIGAGFYIGHFGGIIISPKAKIGGNCTLGTGVVIGTRGFGDEGVPVIGNNVYIGVGAKILGGIKIGNNVRIGANAVVIDGVPDNATVVGVPAKVVKVR